MLALLAVLLNELSEPAAIFDVEGGVVAANARWHEENITTGDRHARHERRVSLPGIEEHQTLELLVLIDGEAPAQSTGVGPSGRPHAPLPHYAPRMLIGNPMGAALDVLTHRERDVALLLARGMRNGDIAATLRISPATARRHTERIFRKLGVQTRAAAAALIAAQHARPRGRRNAPV